MTEPQPPASEGATPPSVPPRTPNGPGIPPGSSAPQAPNPSQGTVQPYPGAAPQPGFPPPPAPPWNGAPQQGAPHPGPGAPRPADPRPKVLAILAFVAALVGIVIAIVPILSWFSWLFFIAAIVLGLIGLISKAQGGKGFSIAALVISGAGWILSIVVTLASLAFVGGLGDLLRDSSPSDRGGSSTREPFDRDARPGAAALAPTVAEVAFGRESFDDATWWYVVVIDNPNTDLVFDTSAIDIEAVASTGTILDSTSDYATLLPGKTVLTGSLYDIGAAEVSRLDVVVPDASDAERASADEVGTFTIEGLTATTDAYSTTVSGTISGTFTEDAEAVQIVVLARDAAGTIIGGSRTYADRVPSDGRNVQFEALFTDPLPADAVYEASARP